MAIHNYYATAADDDDNITMLPRIAHATWWYPETKKLRVMNENTLLTEHTKTQFLLSFNAQHTLHTGKQLMA